ncbi:hypothetical protein POSPLADRAFT_1135558 [Postia placenta MAD-698-R-SB12]|uniref:Stress response RCI peptide n=1 Tax=Postia placenta MAD-698-R-SB12 TaxID=670580 RepID=A0A1X6N8W2_9APHY|nr:hypothetical protein POSPLADRAFT_1135558 [Postia placenta MAD-698-R-SB12]OSX65051.1 hypothetical protein POSPLADRAFT_1135558 [Postia placenta MAD-698-R-SB12]
MLAYLSSISPLILSATDHVSPLLTEQFTAHRTHILLPSFAIILPPVGVFLERGFGADFIINIILTALGYIPGIIHALYIILKY